jgi:hypothetical protein
MIKSTDPPRSSSRMTRTARPMSSPPSSSKTTQTSTPTMERTTRGKKKEVRSGRMKETDRVLLREMRWTSLKGMTTNKIKGMELFDRSLSRPLKLFPALVFISHRLLLSAFVHDAALPFPVPPLLPPLSPIVILKPHPSRFRSKEKQDNFWWKGMKSEIESRLRLTGLRTRSSRYA